MIDSTLRKKLESDTSGLTIYEYIANNINDIDDDMPELVEIMIGADRNGQFVVSTARYLNAIDKDKYAASIDLLIKAAIVKDRERKYLGDLAVSIWGNDYVAHAKELSEKDDNFRRIYKRLYPTGL